MIGSIHSDQRCPLCGSRFKHQEPKGLFCPEHATQRPTAFKVIFKKITRRFDNYPAAYQFLTGLRFEAGSGSFDARDHQIKDKPLSFARLINEWMEIKKQSLSPKTWRDYNAALEHARQALGEANIKSIKYGHIQDLFNGLTNYSSKSKHNLMAHLKQFWTWVSDRYDIEPMKKWPNIGQVVMAFRNTIDLQTQEAILSSIKTNEAFKVWLAIKWLATYIAIRPGEMLSLLENQVDRSRGVLIIPPSQSKTKQPKVIPLIEEDIKIIRGLPLSFNREEPFFRHEERRSSAGIPGRGFSHNQIYRAWKRACARLNIEGVDLYGGTKHSTAMGLREVATFEEVRTMTGHTTNKAFERYFRTEGKALASLYERRKAIVKTSDNELTRPFLKADNI